MAYTTDVTIHIEIPEEIYGIPVCKWKPKSGVYGADMPCELKSGTEKGLLTFVQTNPGVLITCVLNCPKL